MKDNRQEFFEIVGITEDGEIVMLDSIFDHGKGFKGATGSSFYPVYQDDIDNRNDLETLKDSYGYLWQEAVKDGNTEESLESYLEGILESEVTYGGSYFLGHDDSYVHHISDSFKDEYFPDAVTFECVGGGRMFPIKREWKVLLRPDLLDIITKAEAPTLRAV